MPQGPTCHTGSLSCFNSEIESRFKIQALAQTIHQSAKAINLTLTLNIY